MKQILMIILGLCCLACHSDQNIKNQDPVYPELENNLDPQQLATAYCGSCHMYPTPNLLTKEKWKGVLPDMGARLGIKHDGYDPFKKLSMYDAFIVRETKVYPADSLISVDNWNKIVAYYMETAPDTLLPWKEHIPSTIGLALFAVNMLNNLPEKPLSTLVKINSKTKRIYWGSRASKLVEISPSGTIKRELILDSPPSFMKIKEDNDISLLLMGIMDPSDETFGTLVDYDNENNAVLQLSKLQRPVYATYADLDNDAHTDILISQFGNYTGKLSWFSTNESGKYEEHILKRVAGTLITDTCDFNKDGLIDVMALMGQGNEGISIFYNQGRGKFKEKVVLRFPPVYGSTFFQLVDYNGDGFQDILYTNGDNADFSFSLKPYHGIRIFTNDGNNNFKESFFYPMHGAMKAIAQDFDLDGDMDVVAISFFPDFANDMKNSFVYLENKGDFKYKPFTFEEAALGRWLVMDVADMDFDGDMDVVIGSYLRSMPTTKEKTEIDWLNNQYQMVILENNVR